MIKVNYDSTTGEIKGFYPDDIGYASIPEPYIEIDETTHQDCMNNQGSRKVDLTTLSVASYTPAAVVPTKTELLAALDLEYETNCSDLASALVKTQLTSNTTLEADLKTEYATLVSDYTTERAVIVNGN